MGQLSYIHPKTGFICPLDKSVFPSVKRNANSRDDETFEISNNLILLKKCMAKIISVYNKNLSDKKLVKKKIEY